MSDYMREEMWVDRMRDTIHNWEKIQGLEVPTDIQKTIIKFMRKKIRRGIKRGTLIKTFMQIAVTALIYIKMRRIDVLKLHRGQ